MLMIEALSKKTFWLEASLQEAMSNSPLKIFCNKITNCSLDFHLVIQQKVIQQHLFQFKGSFPSTSGQYCNDPYQIIRVFNTLDQV